MFLTHIWAKWISYFAKNDENLLVCFLSYFFFFSFFRFFAQQNQENYPSDHFDCFSLSLVFTFRLMDEQYSLSSESFAAYSSSFNPFIIPFRARSTHMLVRVNWSSLVVVFFMLTLCLFSFSIIKLELIWMRSCIE